MKKIAIKKTDLTVSPVCLGGCPLGGYGWGNTQREELIKTVQTAVDNGINVFDTADTYGLGESERLISEALNSKLNDVVIATKFGVRVENGKTTYDNTRAYAISAVENSLRRLNRDYIDVYYVHYRDGVTPLCEVANTLEYLKKQGKIRYYGLSNLHERDYDELKSFGRDNPFVCVQNEYSLANRNYEAELVNFRDDYGMTPFTWGSLGQGILSGKYDENSCFESNDRRSREIYVNFHGEKLKKNLEIVKVLKEIALETNSTPSAVAISFINAYLKDSVVIVGAKTPAQALANADAMKCELTDEQISKLEKISKE